MNSTQALPPDTSRAGCGTEPFAAPSTSTRPTIIHLQILIPRLWAFRAALIATVLLLAAFTGMAGSWTALQNAAPGNVQLMLQLSDGTVMCSDGGGGAWFKLTPDSNGSYINGSWTTLHSMNYTRRYFSSVILRDGRVFVAGAEYGTGTTNAEIYDPRFDTWTPLPVPAGLITTNNTLNPQGGNTAGFSDSGSVILPGGSVLIAPVYPAAGVGTVIYNPFSNSWSSNALLGNQNEASWVKLPDDSILTIDTSRIFTVLGRSWARHFCCRTGRCSTSGATPTRQSIRPLERPTREPGQPDFPSPTDRLVPMRRAQ
jgi:hypothetical protein